MRARLSDAVAVLVGQRDEGIAAAGAAAAQTSRVREKLAASTALQRETEAEVERRNEAHREEVAALREAGDAACAELRKAHAAQVCT